MLNSFKKIIFFILKYYLDLDIFRYFKIKPLFVFKICQKNLLKHRIIEFFFEKILNLNFKFICLLGYQFTRQLIYGSMTNYKLLFDLINVSIRHN